MTKPSALPATSTAGVGVAQQPGNGHPSVHPVNHKERIGAETQLVLSQLGLNNIQCTSDAHN
jgi:hypothetical protein